MLAEPYICIKGKMAGTIEWGGALSDVHRIGIVNLWQPYADFEREKLKELRAKDGISRGNWGYCIRGEEERSFDIAYNSKDMGYSGVEYEEDSESSRLLKRAEFLKAVCEKERIPWLPKDGTFTKPPHDGKAHGVAGKCDCDFCCKGKHHGCGACKNPHSLMTQAGYEAAVEKAQECPYSCPRAAKLETRLATHYYAKHEIDERISALINRSDMPEDVKRELRTRFL